MKTNEEKKIVLEWVRFSNYFGVYKCQVLHFKEILYPKKLES